MSNFVEISGWFAALVIIRLSGPALWGPFCVVPLFCQFQLFWASHSLLLDSCLQTSNGNVLFQIFEDYYHFEHRKVQKRSLEPDLLYHSNLIGEPGVLWARQQVVKRRSKRDLIDLRPRQRADSHIFSDIRWPQMWYLVSIFFLFKKKVLLRV